MGTPANIDIGPCSVKFGEPGSEVDLGYTKGGVKVSVETEVTDIEVDQETEPVDSLITKRAVQVEVPLAEYTASNLLIALPGAAIYTNPATLTTSLTGDMNDLVFTAKTGNGKDGPGNDISIEYVNPGAVQAACAVVVTGKDISVTLKHDGTSITATAAEVKAAIDGDDDAKRLVTVAFVGEETGTGVVTSMAKTPLSGGKQKLTIRSAAGMSLVSMAKTLVLHPTDKGAADVSEDWTFQKAAPAGNIEATYDKENPKVITLTFRCFPNNGVVGIFGDPSTTQA